MPGTTDNRLILEKYKKLVCEKYAEPKEVIIASFLEPNVIGRLVHQQFKINKKRTF